MEVSDVCERIQKRSTTYGMTLQERAVFNFYRTLRGKSTTEQQQPVVKQGAAGNQRTVSTSNLVPT